MSDTEGGDQAEPESEESYEPPTLYELEIEEIERGGRPEDFDER
jgi:hypothetical protein